MLMCQKMNKRNLTLKLENAFFYGTETKGYRLYDPECARVFHSRDVQFNEHQQETDMVKEQEPVHNTQMELDFPEFEEAIVNEEPVVNYPSWLQK